MRRFALLVIAVTLLSGSVMAAGDGEVVFFGRIQSPFFLNWLEIQDIALGDWEDDLDFFALGLTTDGEIVTWKRSGTSFREWVPAPSGQYQAIAAGLRHALGLTTGGEIVDWGSNTFGQLDNTPSGQFQAIGAGAYHSLGLKTNGEIVGWGCGDGITDCLIQYDPWYSENLDRGQASPPSGQFQAIAAGYDHSLGLTLDGQIVGWGSNEEGQIDTPSGQFQAIAAGKYHSLGLTTGGEIVGWGCLGSPDCYYEDQYGQPTPPPGQFQAIAAGTEHALALKMDGTIVGWGCGDGTDFDCYRDQYNQASPPSGQYQAIAAGSENSVALVVPTPTPPDPCDLSDLAALYAVFNTTTPPTSSQYDLNSDNVINTADLEQWLSMAATVHGHGSPYLRGDTDLDRNVDLADYSALATNFDPSGNGLYTLWQHGNSDGDNDVDLADYNVLASNFSPAGYGDTAVPEPTSVCLLLTALLVLARVRF